MTELLRPILEGCIRSTNFFNGRLLSGEDMSAEQAAISERFCRLGQAVGAGVAYGLQVEVKKAAAGEARDEKTSPVLTIKPGLAVNRCGQAVKLANPVDVALVRSRKVAGDGGVKEPFGC